MKSLLGGILENVEKSHQIKNQTKAYSSTFVKATDLHRLFRIELLSYSVAYDAPINYMKNLCRANDT